jgi:hypothetical protein
MVRDSAGGAILNVSVHVYSEDAVIQRNIITSSDGSFTLNVPAGRYYFELLLLNDRSDLVKPDVLGVDILDGEAKNVLLRFGAVRKSISGKISLSTGEAVTDGEVTASSLLTNQFIVAPIDAQGAYHLQVGGGAWQVSVRSRNGASVRWSPPVAPQTITFQLNTISESATANFFLDARTATVSITVTSLRSGGVVSGAGVVLDSVDSQGVGQGGVPSSQFQKTDGSGVAQFTVRSGTYHVRVYPASGSGFTNSIEQTLTVGAGGSQNLTVSLPSLLTYSAQTISGVTTFSDGTPVDALVSAWSDTGGFAETRAKADGGSYALALSFGTWHIRAQKDVRGSLYHSSEVILSITSDSQSCTSSCDIVLAKDVALAPAVVVTQPVTQSVVAHASDGAQVTVPATAAGESGTVTVQVTPTGEAPSQGAAQVIGRAYDIKIKDQSGQVVSQLQKDVEIILPYHLQDLKKERVSEDALIPSYFDESVGAWVRVANFTINKEKSEVVVRVNHLTRFALVAAADITPPLPPQKITAVRGKAGEAILSWVNPVKDFDHVKIYRSTQAKKLGVLALGDVVANSSHDAGLSKGTYYYTVRSVDPAGNESNNVEQMSVVILEGGSSANAKSLLRNLRFGMQGEDVKLMQQILTKEGVYRAGITGFFGKLTQKAVMDFQEKYRAEVLQPAGLLKGTGFVGAGTRAKLNALIF